MHLYTISCFRGSVYSILCVRLETVIIFLSNFLIRFSCVIIHGENTFFSKTPQHVRCIQETLSLKFTIQTCMNAYNAVFEELSHADATMCNGQANVPFYVVK